MPPLRGCLWQPGRNRAVLSRLQASAWRDSVRRGAGRPGWSATAPLQTFSGGATRQGGQLKLAACGGRSPPGRSAVGSASSADPGPHRTPARSVSVQGRRAVPKAGTPPQDHFQGAAQDSNRYRNRPSWPDRVPGFACAGKGYPGRPGTASPPHRGVKGLHTGRALPLDIPALPIPLASRQAKHDFW